MSPAPRHGLRRLVQGRHVAIQRVRAHPTVLRRPRPQGPARNRPLASTSVELDKCGGMSDRRTSRLLRCARRSPAGPWNGSWHRGGCRQILARSRYSRGLPRPASGRPWLRDEALRLAGDRERADRSRGQVRHETRTVNSNAWASLFAHRKRARHWSLMRMPRPS